MPEEGLKFFWTLQIFICHFFVWRRVPLLSRGLLSYDLNDNSIDFPEGANLHGPTLFYSFILPADAAD